MKTKCTACGFEGKPIHVMEYDETMGYVARMQAFLVGEEIMYGALKACPKCKTVHAFISEQANKQMKADDSNE